eukprot:406835_1
MIGYPKESNAYAHPLDETEFGAYFIGSNKENKDTSNNNMDNPHDHEPNAQDNLIPQDLHLSLDVQNELNDENNRALTPLNGDTKLSFSAKDSWRSKPNQTRLYEVPKKKAMDIASDIKSLPSLPATPSPPRMIRNKRSMARKYHHPVEALNYNQNDYYFEDYNGYSSSKYTYNRYRDHDEQEWFNKRKPKHSYYTNNDSYDNYYGSSASGKDNTSMYPHYSNSYRSAPGHSNTSQRGSYSKYAPKAPRFQLQSENTKHHGRSVCKWWAKGAVCKNGSECPWSHCTTYDDIRKRVTNYKTKPCVDPGRGLKCEYNDRCNFAHPGEALRRPMPIEYSDRQYFKLLLRDCP